MRLLFKADTSRAIPELQRLRESTKEADRATKELQQSQERIARGTSPGVTATGGVAGVGSRSAGHMASVTPTPPPLPGTHARSSFGSDILDHAATRAALGITALASAIDRLNQSVGRSGFAVDAGGQNLTGMNRAQFGASSFASDVPGVGTFGRLADMAQFQSAGGRFYNRMRFGDGRNLRQVGERQLLEESMRLGVLPARIEQENRLRDLGLEGRGLAMGAEASGAFANMTLARMPEYQRMLADERFGGAGLVGAHMGVDRARANFGAAQRAAGLAGQDTEMARLRVGGAERALAEARRTASTGRGPEHAANAGIFPTAAAFHGANMAGIAEREARLVEERRRLEAAITQERKAQADLAQRGLELGRSQVELSRNQLAINQGERQKLLGGAAGYFTSSPHDRMVLESTLRRAKEVGFENISERERALLAGNAITGDFARQGFERLATNDPSFNALVQSAGGRPLGDLNRDIERLTREITFRPAIDEATVRSAMSQAFDQFYRELEQIATDVVNDRMQQLRREQSMQQAGQRGAPQN
jgi:hypothetical protein